MPEKGVKAIVLKGHKTLVLYCHPSEFFFIYFILKILFFCIFSEERLESLLPQIRMDTSTGSVIT